MSKERLYIFDTTLRDGAQTQGVDFSIEDKEKIASALDNLGVDYIEGGWPGANPTDTEFFQKKHNFKNSKLTSFGMTKRSGRSAENDTGLSAIMNSNTSAVCLVGKSWDFHVDIALGITNEENLDNISESAKHFVKAKKEFMFDAEHFFDGYKANSKYAISCIKAAYDQGARWIVLCDTNGGTLPHEVEDIVSKVSKEISGDHLGIHAHNDTGNAVANTLAAVRAGARQVQGTINGLGERCGNANLISLLPTFAFKNEFENKFDLSINKQQLNLLTELSRLLDEILNRVPNRTAPYVGSSAFAHKGGLHVSAVNKDPKTYEHINPELVGNQRQIIISEQSGKSNILSKLKSAGIEVNEDDKTIQKILDRVKEREFNGYSYDGADASFEILVNKVLGKMPEYFEVISFNVNVQNSGEEGQTMSEASVKLKIDNDEIIGTGKGVGPVNALDNALRNNFKSSRYAEYINDLSLIDYKVRILNTGTDAITRVSIESSDANKKSWYTIGVSENIIEASFRALIDSVEFKLMKEQVKV